MASERVVANQQAASVSVIIAAWNCADFIHHAIYSALQQDEVPLEVIVIDDASTDDTAARVDDMAKNDLRLRLIKQASNGGPAEARNRGIAEASHEWVAVLDADDAFKPGRLKSLMMLAKRSKADIVADNFVYRNAASGRLTAPAVRRLTGEQHLDLYRFLDGARPFASDVDLGLLKPVFRKSFLERYGLCYPVDVRHGEDFEMILRALSKGARYILDPSSAYYIYTDRSSGWSRTAVDYSGQIARSRLLASQAPYVDDPRSVYLLNQRASALIELEKQHRELQRYRSSGRFHKLGLNLTSTAGLRRLAKGVRDYLVR